MKAMIATFDNGEVSLKSVDLGKHLTPPRLSRRVNYAGDPGVLLGHRDDVRFNHVLGTGPAIALRDF